jgi:hypothetical protein
MQESDPNWTVGRVVREILRGLKRQPGPLLAALVVVPTIWYVPADFLNDWLIPDEARASGAVPIWVDLTLIATCTIWSCVLAGGQMQIAVDYVRGSPVRWSRFREGVRQALRVAVTSLPFMAPFGVVLVLPEGDWLEVWALPLLMVAVGLAVTLSARTILWAPLVVDGQRSLGDALMMSWAATHARTWRIVRLGLALGIPLLPLLVLETAVLGESWVACGLLGGLYTLASARLYVLMRAEAAVVAPNLSSDEAAKSQDVDVELPRRGSGWSRPFE